MRLRRMMSDWKVELVEDNISEFYVDFGGPKDSEHAMGTQTAGSWRAALGHGGRARDKLL